MKFFDWTNGTKVKVNRPFSAGGVSCMTYSNCGRFLIAAGSGIGEILVYDTLCLTEETQPVAVIPVRETPIQLMALNSTLPTPPTSTKKKQDMVSLDILCVFHGGGEGCIIRCIHDLHDITATTSTSPMITTIPIQKSSVASSESSSSLLAASFCNNPDMNGTLVVAMASLTAPRFTRLIYADMDKTSTGSIAQGSVVSNVSLPDGPSGQSSEQNGHLNGETPSTLDVTLVGPYQLGGSKRPLVLDDNDDGENISGNMKKTRMGDLTERGGGGDMASTLEERLNSLNSALALADSRTGHDNTSTGKKTSKEVVGRPTSDSLVVLVEQALQSGDDALLEQCLQCGDADVVTATARLLPSNRIVPFLRRLVAKFEKRPTRGVLVTRWIQAVLKFHVSYLLSVPDLAKQLAGLSQMLEQRLSTYTRLASLAGRLDLLMAQQSAIDQVADDSDAEGDSTARERRKKGVAEDGVIFSVPKDIYYEE